MHFVVNGKTNFGKDEFFIRNVCITKGSVFAKMKTSGIPTKKDEKGRFILNDEDPEKFHILCTFINELRWTSTLMRKLGIPVDKSSPKAIEHLEYIFNVIDEMMDKYCCNNIVSVGENHYNNIEHVHWWIMLRENWMRNCMYKPEFCYHEMNTNKLYALQTFESDDDLKKLKCNIDVVGKFNNELLFRKGIDGPPEIVSWESVSKSLQEIDFLANMPGVFVAGGYIFSALTGVDSPDIDLFLFQEDGTSYETDEEAIDKIHEIAQVLKDKWGTECLDGSNQLDLITRSKYAITINVGKSRKPVQIILRIYKSPSEILHGFDVDSCCFGYKYGKILATTRAVKALQSGFNQVDFDRLSPSYEYRLAKYATRGMAIAIPGFYRVCVNSEVLNSYVQYGSWREKHGDNIESRYRQPHRSLKGLNLLLFLEAYYNDTKHKKRVSDGFIKLAYEHSDYSTAPIHDPLYHSDMHTYVDYLSSSTSENDYPEFYDKYITHFTNYTHSVWETLDSHEQTKYISKKSEYTIHEACQDDRLYRIHINNFLSATARKKIIYVATPVDTLLPNILNINEHLYKAFDVVGIWEIPRKIEFKRVQPGEQTTSSFHKIVLEDPNTWYTGIFYKHISL